LIADMLRISWPRLRRLHDCYREDAGQPISSANPHAEEKKPLTFNAEAARGSGHRSVDEPISDNVVELVTERIGRLHLTASGAGALHRQSL
jgi:hypothetical protein